MATDPHIVPPTSGRPDVPVTREELPDTDQHDVATDPTQEEFGQLVAKPSVSLPKLTFKEEHERQAQRERDYRSAVTHKENFTCPECDGSIEGRVHYKHHLKDVHRWRENRITEHLGNRRLQKRLNPTCVDVPLEPFAQSLSPEVVKILTQNRIRPEDLRDVREIAPEILDVLKCGAGSSSRVRHEIIKPPSHRKAKQTFERSQEEMQEDFELMFNSPGLTLVVPDDDDRKCFLVYHILKKSMSETAMEVYGSSKRKPHVQNVVERVRQNLMAFLQKGQRNAKLREDGFFIRIVELLRGTQDAGSFELEIENFKVTAQKSRQGIDYNPPDPDVPTDDQ